MSFYPIRNVNVWSESVSQFILSKMMEFKSLNAIIGDQLIGCYIFPNQLTREGYKSAVPCRTAVKFPILPTLA